MRASAAPWPTLARGCLLPPRLFLRHERLDLHTRQPMLPRVRPVALQKRAWKMLYLSESLGRSALSNSSTSSVFCSLVRIVRTVGGRCAQPSVSSFGRGRVKLSSSYTWGGPLLAAGSMARVACTPMARTLHALSSCIGGSAAADAGATLNGCRPYALGGSSGRSTLRRRRTASEALAHLGLNRTLISFPSPPSKQVVTSRRVNVGSGAGGLRWAGSSA